MDDFELAEGPDADPNDGWEVGDVLSTWDQRRRMAQLPQSVRDLCQDRVRQRMRAARVRQGWMDL